MDIESNEQILNIAGIQQLCKNQKKVAQGQPQTQICSFLGIVIDYSNWISGFQKIFVIDESNQKQPLQIFLRGDFPDEFVTTARIGDIIYFRYFQVAFYEGQLLALRSEDIKDCKFDVIVLGNEVQRSAMRVQGANNIKEKLLKQRIEVLRLFSFNYFSTKRIILGSKSQKMEQNPEYQSRKVLKKQNKNIILRIINCEIHKNRYYIKMTDQRQTFTMKFGRRIEPGVYLIRAFGSIIKRPKYHQIQAQSNTNIIQISPWMRSYQIEERLDILGIVSQQISKFNVSTKIQRQNVAQISLQSLIRSDEHTKDLHVRCQIMNVTTPFEQVFRRLVKRKKGKLTYYQQFSWDHPEGELILFVHMYISDPTLNGQIFSVYLYSFDGKGNQFIPGLKMETVQESLGQNQALLKKQYNEFVNTLLQKTNYQKLPLELIISPLSNRKQGTVYRIIDTALSFD